MQPTIDTVPADIPQDRRPLVGAVSQRRYALAGRSIVALRNAATNVHHVFRVRESGDLGRWYVDVLVDGAARRPLFLGTIHRRGLRYVHSHSSTLPAGEGVDRAFGWWWWRVQQDSALPASLEVWTSGRCGKCGQLLTDPASVERGIGPVCWGHVRSRLDIAPRLLTLADALADGGWDAALWARGPKALRTVEAGHVAALLRYLAAGDLSGIASAVELLQALDADREALRCMAGVAGQLAYQAQGAPREREALRAALSKIGPARLAGWWLP